MIYNCYILNISTYIICFPIYQKIAGPTISRPWPSLAPGQCISGILLRTPLWSHAVSCLSWLMLFCLPWLVFSQCWSHCCLLHLTVKILVKILMIKWYYYVTILASWLFKVMAVEVTKWELTHLCNLWRIFAQNCWSVMLLCVDKVEALEMLKWQCPIVAII